MIIWTIAIIGLTITAGFLGWAVTDIVICAFTGRKPYRPWEK